MSYNQERSNHLVKEQVRRDIISDLKSLNRVHNRILTLPSLNFDLELEALSLKYKVNTVERDTSIFCKQFTIREEMDAINLKNKIGRFNLTLNNESLFNFIWRNPFKQFDLVYADTCGPLCEDTIHSLISLGLRRTPIVYVTFLLSREKNKYKHLLSKDNRTEDYQRLFDFANYRIDRTYRYLNNISNMCTFKLVLKDNIKVFNDTDSESESKVDSFITSVSLVGQIKRRRKASSFGSLNKTHLLLNKKILEMGFNLNQRYIFEYEKYLNVITLKPSENGRKFSMQKYCNSLVIWFAKEVKENNIKDNCIINEVENNNNN